MALSRVTTWTSGQVLTASALNAEFNNIIDNGLSLISPLTGNLNVNAFVLQNVASGTVSSPGLTISGSTGTGVYSPSTNQVALAANSVEILNGVGVTGATSYLQISQNSAVQPDAVTLTAAGVTNTSVRIVPSGTGYLMVPAGSSNGGVFLPGVTTLNDLDTGMSFISGGTLDFITNGQRAFSVSSTLNATNYLVATPAVTSGSPTLSVNGPDANIDLTLATQGAGVVRAATAFVPAALANNPPPAHAIVRDNVVKAWCTFDGHAATLAILGTPYNISSLTQNGTGDYTLTFRTAFSATNYAMLGTAKTVGTSLTNRILMSHNLWSAQTTTTARFIIANGGVTVDGKCVSVAFIGHQ